MNFIAVMVLTLVSIACPQAGNGNHQVSLHWIASTTPSVTYNVYRKQQGATNFTKIRTGLTTTAFVDSNVQVRRNYSYFVTASASGLESAQSNTFTITVP